MRASRNFSSTETFSTDWYMAIGKVKLACYHTVAMFRDTLEKMKPEVLNRLHLPSMEIIRAMETAATEVASGQHFNHFIIPPLQGGAGTSINMNINEIISNRALQIMGRLPGSYDIIDPVESANIYQSTNDVIPTSLTVAVLTILDSLEQAINDTRQSIQDLEKRYRNTLRIGYTQMQQAVPGTYGQLFSNYSDALSRDWWRVSKASERIKQINLGGGATGTGVSIPRFFIMEVSNQLRKITGVPLAQGENFSDNTSNLDSHVEVHAILKSHAVNMDKMVNDLRLLASDISPSPDINIPSKQTGSSIMPGKVNPVIPEFVQSASQEIYSNDNTITQLAASGTLDLNAYLPSIGHSLVKSLKTLISINKTVKENLLNGLTVNEEVAANKLYRSPAVVTAISPLIGYHEAGKLAKEMKQLQCNIFQANEKLRLLPGRSLDKMMEPAYLLKKGFSVQDIEEMEKEKNER